MGNLRIGPKQSLPVEPTRSGYSKEKGKKAEFATFGEPIISTLGENISECLAKGVQGQELSERTITKGGGYTPKGLEISLPNIPK